MTQNLWDAAKAVLRGKFTAIQSYLKKQDISQINNLTLHLKQLEKEEQKHSKELTNEDLMELEAQRKDKERQEEEEVTEEPKRVMMQEMAKGFSLFEEALLVFEA